MKKIFKVIILGALLALVFNGCQKEDPVDTSGPARDKFIGTWKVTSHHSNTHLPATQYWEMTISAGSSSPDQILISDFDLQTGTITYATVTGSDFSIPYQQISGENIQGAGSYSGGTLSFHYVAVDAETDSVTATAVRK